ncbi:MAG: metallophosphoesterase [Candidatus Latescibacteria bacterium]|nr:metallophosphoesterase [Candidatus Latescibacterota bacterium]
MRRIGIAATVAAAAVTALVSMASAGQTSEEWRFVVMGDSRPPGGGKDPTVQPDTFLENIKGVNLLGAELVVNVGDLVLGPQPEEVIPALWDGYDKAISDFEMPVYAVAGNHDIWDTVSERIYQERVKPLWYSFDHKDAHFIVLNSEEQSDDRAHFEKIAGAQMTWLKADLAKSKGAGHTFVFMHKPLWTSNYSGARWMEEVHPLLAAHKVDAVFCGHIHIYEKHPRIDGVRYLITGGAGAELRGYEEEGGFHHFVVVRVQPEALRLAVVRTGAIEADDVVTPESAGVFRAFMQTARQSVPRVTLDRPASFPAEITESLHVANATDQAMAITVSLNDPTDRWGCTPATRSAHLEPGDGFDLPFTLSVGSADEWVYPTPEISALIRFVDGRELSAKKKIVLRESYICPRTGNVKVDGDLSDWKGVPAIVLDSRLQVGREDFRETWRGPDDLGARVMLRWTPEGLYFAAEVTDDVFLQTQKPYEMWRNDCIQIAFDGKNDDTEKYGEDDSEYGLALIGGKSTVYTYFRPHASGREDAPKITCAIRRSEDGKRVFYEAMAPWEDVGISEPRVGATFGFNLIVNDSDTGRRRGWIGWTPGVGESKAPYYFGDVTLGEQ